MILTNKSSSCDLSVTQQVRKNLLCLADAARCAPSGDNTQPWSFRLDEDEERLSILLDGSRDNSPMNAGQRMARIALGAAIVNVSRTLENNLESTEYDLQISENAATVVFSKACNSFELCSDPVIYQRHTNRRIYDRNPLGGPAQTKLERFTPSSRAIRLHWEFERAGIKRLAELIGRSDALMFSDRSVFRAFLDNVCFDRFRQTPIEEGLSPATLEITRFEALGMRILGSMPAGVLARCENAFRTKGQGLAESSSGLCLGICTGNEAATDVDAGRTMQEVWLELTTMGLSVQPMMSLPVLEAMAFDGTRLRHSSNSRSEDIEPSSGFRTTLPLKSNERICFIQRFGNAHPPTGRTSRRPLQSMICDVHVEAASIPSLAR